MSAPHILVVSRDPDPQLGASAYLECPGVTPECAMWVRCEQDGCPTAADDEGPAEGIWRAEFHGVEHRWFDEEVSREFWGVETDQCYAVEQNDAPAEEFAEEQQLGSGRYPVTVEIDGNAVILSRTDPARAR